MKLIIIIVVCNAVKTLVRAIEEAINIGLEDSSSSLSL